MKANPQFATPQLVIFDKDGTLIDFRQMWGRWAFAFADRISVAIQRDERAAILALYGVDADTHVIHPQGALAIAPMPLMQQLVAHHIAPHMASLAHAYILVQQLWQPPDPVTDAVPLADVPALCQDLRRQGILIAVATADDRSPTQATLAHLGIADAVAVMACADDAGVAPKPAPDKIYAVCATLAIAPQHAIMVGDTPADMQMGANAGVLARVGVTSGLATAHDLAPWATHIIPDIRSLLQLW